MYIIDKYQLVKYIEDKYKKDYHENITTLKLHKSLYFLFGYWVLEELVADERGESLKNRFLFNSNFQANKYGPVEYDIYHKNNKITETAEISLRVTNFLNEALEKIFKVSDFQLMNISYTHDCWKNAYNSSCDKTISSEAITETFLGILKNEC